MNPGFSHIIFSIERLTLQRLIKVADERIHPLWHYLSTKTRD